MHYQWGRNNTSGVIFSNTIRLFETIHIQKTTKIEKITKKSKKSMNFRKCYYLFQWLNLCFHMVNFSVTVKNKLVFNKNYLIESENN